MADGNQDVVKLKLTGDRGLDTDALPWRHSVFVCPLHREDRVPISEYAKTTDLMESGIIVPGSTNPAKTVSRARPCLLRLLRQSYQLFWIVRRAGFTFRGHFSRHNLVVYRPKPQPRETARNRKRKRTQLEPARSDDQLVDEFVVRMTGRLHLSVYNREDAVQDDRSFVWVVFKLLYLSWYKDKVPVPVPVRVPVPVDIQKWLELINNRGVGNEYLVRYHISLMDHREALSVLISFRKRLQFLRRRRPSVYASIIYRMAPLHDWNAHEVKFSNSLLESTRDFILKARANSERQIQGFDPNVQGVEGVLSVIRHCSEHAARGYEHKMLLIAEDNLPNFASDLHSAMFQAGELAFLHLENRMG